jgi:hypothetical protein
MKSILLTLTCLITVFATAQKDVQKKYFVFDLGMTYTSAFNFANKNDMIPKIGYTSNIMMEHQFNSGKSFRIGLGSSLNGFALDTRFRNVLHTYNLNLPIQFGRKYKSGDRFYFGIIPAFCFKSSYSEEVIKVVPNKFDVKIQFSYAVDFNKFVGIDFSAQAGVLNVGIYKNGHVSNWSLIAKFYVRKMTKRSVSFIAN